MNVYRLTNVLNTLVLGLFILLAGVGFVGGLVGGIRYDIANDTQVGFYLWGASTLLAAVLGTTLLVSYIRIEDWITGLARRAACGRSYQDYLNSGCRGPWEDATARTRAQAILRGLHLTY